MKATGKSFWGSNWAINNRMAVYIITALITLAGIWSYNTLPKENFPDIVIPTVYVATVNPGTSPGDMENLVTKPIEKEIKAISGVKKFTSNSLQDFSTVIVEFNAGIDVAQAKQKVKDAVDKARAELPNDLPRDPDVFEVNFSEIPIEYVNVSGKYDLNRLKRYAEALQDRIEAQPQITRVDMVGALTREILIDVNMYKMEAAGVSLDDIGRAIQYENLTISGGTIRMDGTRRSLSVLGEFTNAEQINNLLVKASSGAAVYLRDIASVVDGFAEKESYARLDGQNVITLNIIKRSGENLIDASDNINAVIAEMRKSGELPEALDVVVTGDQSESTRVTLHDLINTIIIGFVLVTLVLMFFMGVTNALFVALSVPLSMFLAFLVFPSLGFSLNVVTLFSFLLALGIVVDDAIVVIENTHRIFDNGRVPIKIAAKEAAGEVFMPVLAGTITTISPFIPLMFWPGIIGKFMYFLPVTLIVTLFASLLVAYFINPVFAVDTMKPHKSEEDLTADDKKKRTNKLVLWSLLLGGTAFWSYVFGGIAFGNFTLFVVALLWINRFVLHRATEAWQFKIWPRFQNGFGGFLSWFLRYKWVSLVGMMVLFVLSIFLFSVKPPKIEFFPQADPNFVYTYIKMPIGTDQKVTDSITRVVENRIMKVLGPNNKLVESVISNVAIGAGEDQQGGLQAEPHKGKVGIAFVKFAERGGESTAPYLEKVGKAVKGIPGAEISVGRESGGPPTGKPIAIEVAGEDFNELIKASEGMRAYLSAQNVPGVEELKTDLQAVKPRVVIDIDRERANREGISTGTIGLALRNAVFGLEASKLRDANDEYKIMVRFAEEYRNNAEALLNMRIAFRDQATGRFRSIPLSSVATVRYDNTFGGISRKNQKRVVTISSNVLPNFNENEVVEQLKPLVANYKAPSTVTARFAGAQEDQKETSDFLGLAGAIAFGLIFLVLVTQFNSLSKPLIIMTEIFFSIVGVLLGLALTGMAISIVMTGVGIVALAGIVVRNGILIIEFADLLRKDEGKRLLAATIEAGQTRMTPVILTATAAILGLIPLAIGLNIDFAELFATGDPHIFLGGDNVAFWGPLSWTIIFGLSFATFVTLIIVPVLYLMVEGLKLQLGRFDDHTNPDDLSPRMLEKYNEWLAKHPKEEDISKYLMPQAANGSGNGQVAGAQTPQTPVTPTPPVAPIGFA